MVEEASTCGGGLWVPPSSRLVRANCIKAVLRVLIVVGSWPAGLSDNRTC